MQLHVYTSISNVEQYTNMYVLWTKDSILKFYVCEKEK